MSGRRLWILAAVFGLAGCCGTGSQSRLFTRNAQCDRCATPPVPDQRLSPVPFPPGGPGPSAPSPAPTELPPYTPPPYTPPPMATDSGGRVNIGDPTFRPSNEPAPRYTPPEPANAQVRLDVPIPVETNAKPPSTDVKPLPPDPVARTEPPSTTEPPPVDVPGYTVVRERVASGQQPFPDGIAWLQTKGYRTVLHLRAPGEDGTAARRQFEKRGLQYVSLEVAPGALTKELAEQFKQVVADETNLPLYVMDKDGALTGSLWYLHFRLNGMADDKALAEAKRLGFRPEQDEDHKALFTAARTLLTTMQP